MTSAMAPNNGKERQVQDNRDMYRQFTLDRIKYRESEALQFASFSSQQEQSFVRIGFLLNGGAIVAALTFYGNLITGNGTEIISTSWALNFTTWAINLWSLGLIFAVVSAFSALESQRAFMKARRRHIESIEENWRDNHKLEEQKRDQEKCFDRRGRLYLTLMKIFGVFSILIFIIGSITAISALSALQ
jgi:hypothetical protein